MRVIVAYDGSPGADKAVGFALGLKDSIDKYFILYVSRDITDLSGQLVYISDETVEQQERLADEIVNKAKSLMTRSGVDYEVMKVDSNGEDISKVIVKIAQEKGIDVIFTGTRKLRGLDKFFLGSISSGILALSSCPVIVVPP
ncbi:hypothetical protein [Thermoplasma volcanium GSS1]|uniref:UspA domain-containing protein n=1 Tax=Thermoplasma volcanium (strain ATCC 51530 / DSM 4299 / JCM 9571 / NBRC 15438 / GSS1) TaxID=273116 RepID=Q97AU3_THEVO|nr:universal stress protein [Thermoplasma volcanium]BAB59858.1 hypothetical protein [Thermoplasma volcanium GSS1]